MMQNEKTPVALPSMNSSEVGSPMLHINSDHERSLRKLHPVRDWADRVPVRTPPAVRARVGVPFEETKL